MKRSNTVKVRKKEEGRQRIDLRPALEESLSYIKDIRWFILSIIAIFVFSALIGFLFPSKFMFVEDFIREIVQTTRDMRGLELIIFIFQNNVTSALFGLLLGVFFGIFSIINAMTNGIVLGYVFWRVYGVSGISDFWRILPHGIFELPAIFIALGSGLHIGMFIFSANKMQTIMERLKKGIVAFILVVIPLLVVAAIIEGTLITLLE